MKHTCCECGHQYEDVAADCQGNVVEYYCWPHFEELEARRQIEIDRKERAECMREDYHNDERKLRKA